MWRYKINENVISKIQKKQNFDTCLELEGCCLPNTVKFPRDDGMFPKKLLSARFKSCKLLSFPISEGISPNNLFCYIWRSPKLIKFPILVGIFPDILLLSKYNVSRVVEKLIMHFGNSPPMLLACIANVVI